MRKNKYMVGILIVFILLCFVSPINAQSRSVTMLRRDGDITILASGNVQVVETWEVQFTGGPFRSAFRSIPSSTLTDIVGWEVKENGIGFNNTSSESPGNYNVLQVNNEKRITWYFSETTNQTRTFTLSYLLVGALRLYNDGDQLYLKFIEANRGYPINSSKVQLHLPTAFEPSQLKVATYLNTERQEGARVMDGKTIEFKGGPFASNVEWEIRAQFPHGAVIANPTPQQLREQQIQTNNFISILAFVLILFGGFAGLILLWYTRGRDMPAGRIANYLAAPPEDLSPGMAGTLLDERADLRDIVATLVDLARRGFIAMTSIAITKTDNAAGTLRPFEQNLMDELFVDGGMQKFSDLSGRFKYRLPILGNAIYQELVNAAYLFENPNEVRKSYTNYGMILFVIAGVGGTILFIFLSSVAPLILLPIIAIILLAIGLLVLSRYMPRKTRQGSKAAAKWNAFRNYLWNIERYTKLEQATEQFEKYLPYAIAFGFEKTWVKKFAAVDTPAPSWYDPSPTIFPTWSNDDNPRPGFDSDAGHGSSSGGGSTFNSTSDSPRPSTPSLDQAAQGALHSLDSISASFFSTLNAAAESLHASPQPAAAPSSPNFFDSLFSSSGSSGSGSSSSDNSTWSSSDYSSSSSDSGGGWSGGGDSGGSSSSSDSGGGGSGGGSSGFG